MSLLAILFVTFTSISFAQGGGFQMPSPEERTKTTMEKLADLKNSEQFKEAGQMEDMMQSITFSSTFNLPKAAKNISGEKLKLSDDKKTATINYTLLDVIKSPSSLEYKIEY